MLKTQDKDYDNYNCARKIVCFPCDVIVAPSLFIRWKTMGIGQYLTGVSGKRKGTHNFASIAGIATGTFDRWVKTMARYVQAVANEFF